MWVIDLYNQLFNCGELLLVVIIENNNNYFVKVVRNFHFIRAI